MPDDTDLRAMPTADLLALDPTGRRLNLSMADYQRLRAENTALRAVCRNLAQSMEANGLDGIAALQKQLLAHGVALSARPAEAPDAWLLADNHNQSTEEDVCLREHVANERKKMLDKNFPNSAPFSITPLFRITGSAPGGDTHE